MASQQPPVGSHVIEPNGQGYHLASLLWVPVDVLMEALEKEMQSYTDEGKKKTRAQLQACIARQGYPAGTNGNQDPHDAESEGQCQDGCERPNNPVLPCQDKLSYEIMHLTMVHLWIWGGVSENIMSIHNNNNDRTSHTPSQTHMTHLRGSCTIPLNITSDLFKHVLKYM